MSLLLFVSLMVNAAVGILSISWFFSRPLFERRRVLRWQALPPMRVVSLPPGLGYASNVIDPVDDPHQLLPLPPPKCYCGFEHEAGSTDTDALFARIEAELDELDANPPRKRPPPTSYPGSGTPRLG